MVRNIIYISLIAIALLAFFNGVQEGNLFSGLIGMAFAMIGPIMFTRVVPKIRQKSEFHGFSNAGVIFINCVVILAYALYLFAGPSDPDTAGHMHIILFPILIIFFGTFVMAFFILIDFIREKTSNKPLHSNQNPQTDFDR